VTSSEVQVAQAWVIDTNIVLDLWLFEDPATIPLRAALQSGAISHLATASMRDELERVLAYPHLVKRMARSNIQAQDILSRFDEYLLAAEPAVKAACTCKDPDDQKFIDLAVAHAVPLLSKDKAILCM
jgi:putative PIN family toxin of toxin-antitoxin system